MTSVFFVPLLAFANRVRGGLFGKAPIRWLFIVSIILGIILTVLYNYIVGFAWGAAFTIWGVRGWGRWYDLGRLPENYNRPGPPVKGSFEWNIEWIAKYFPRFGGRIHKDHWCLFVRHLIIVLALLVPSILTGPSWLFLLGFPSAILFVLMYEIGWQLYDRKYTKEPTAIGEWLTGVIWGILLVIAL